MTWIKIEDSLPEKNQYVITYLDKFYDDDRMRIMKICMSIYTDKLVFSYADGEYEYKLDEVIAWMPLPNPPEVE